jgi:putative ABC transport system permease protein
VIGLTVGLACCALVAVFLRYELAWDAHHADADRIYRLLDVERATTLSTIPFPNWYGATPAQQRAVAERLPQEVSGVQQAAVFKSFEDPIFVRTADGDAYQPDRFLMTNTGPAVADLFTFDRLAGAPLADALAQPYSAVLTRSAARRYFGDQNPIGQTLEVDSLTTTVRAVVADPPTNSRLQFDLAVQVKKIPYWAGYHYVRLTPGTEPASILPAVTEIMREVNPRRTRDESDIQATRLQPLTDIYLAPPSRNDVGPHRNPAYLWAFGAIGGLILLITTVNYANLALALYADRNAEIGVRKALGGRQGQIAGQFLVEAGLLALACVPLALLASAAVLPAFNALMGTQIAAGRLFRPVVLATMVGLALLAGLVAGGYPAFVLARKRTINLFGRGLGGGGGGRRGWSLRHGLIGLQFVVLIGLGSLSWIAYGQLRYMQESDLGYQTENIVEIESLQGDSAAYQQLRQRLASAPSIEAIGVGSTPRGDIGNRGTFSVGGDDRVYENTKYRMADPGWFDVMGIEHPAIETMKENGPAGSERILLNRSAAELVQTDNPVGKMLTANPQRPDQEANPIVGVIPDKHFTSMRHEIPPAHYHVFPTAPRAYEPLVRIAPGRTDEALREIRAVWSELKPNTPLRTSFLEDEMGRIYAQERQFSTLAAVLAGLAIVLAAIGLASLVAYLTRLRTKEIGVRKALGGSTRSIVALLNREYAWIVGAAFVVGAPLAWVAADWWLGRFAYRIDLSVGPFLAAGVGALVVAVLAVSTQALRAARLDPAKVLRSE